MTTKEFRAQLKDMGIEPRKQHGLEVLDLYHEGDYLCSVTYAELYPVTNAEEILEEKLRPEYIPPLG